MPGGATSAHPWLPPLLLLPELRPRLLLLLLEPPLLPPLPLGGGAFTDIVGPPLLVLLPLLLLFLLPELLPPLPGVSLVTSMGSCSPEKAVTCNMHDSAAAQSLLQGSM